MIKNKTVLENKIGERTYEFICNSDSPLGELHDTLCLFKGYVVERIVEAQKIQQEQSASIKVEEKNG